MQCCGDPRGARGCRGGGGEVQPKATSWQWIVASALLLALPVGAVAGAGLAASVGASSDAGALIGLLAVAGLAFRKRLRQCSLPLRSRFPL